MILIIRMGSNMPAKGHSGAGEIKSPVAARNRFAPICFAAGESQQPRFLFSTQIKGRRRADGK